MKLFLILIAMCDLAWAEDLSEIDCDDEDVSCNFAPRAKPKVDYEALFDAIPGPDDDDEHEAKVKALELKALGAHINALNEQSFRARVQQPRSYSPSFYEMQQASRDRRQETFDRMDKQRLYFEIMMRR